MSDSGRDQVTVLGAGTMGAGIALAFAAGGAEVVIAARREASLLACQGRLQSGRADVPHETDADSTLGRIAFTTDVSAGLVDSQLVVETITENLDAKQQLLRLVAQQVHGDTIIASNTSSLDLDDVFDGVSEPGRTAGLHWFNPPQLVKLVEVVRARGTTDATVARLVTWMDRLGKAPIVVNRAIPGYIANRLQYALLREAYALVEAGVCTFDGLDRAVTTSIGARWAAIGPFTSMDLAGLDVHLAVATSLFPLLSNAQQAPARLQELVDVGDLGARSGRGLCGDYVATRTAALTDHRATVLSALDAIDGTP